MDGSPTLPRIAGWFSVFSSPSSHFRRRRVDRSRAHLSTLLSTSPTMRPVRISSQPRSTAVQPSIRRPVAARAADKSSLPSASTTAPARNVRYVEVPGSVPANDSPWHTNNANFPMMGSTQSPSPSPLTVSSSSKGRGWSPIVMEDQGRSRPTSPYGFMPIGGKEDSNSGRFTPPASPYSFHKPRTVSPSMMSILTEDTTETGSMTLDSRSMTPTTYYRASPREWESPRPKTPTGRKSPFKKEDDSIRKSRIKTEMCMHYNSGRVCPFGAGESTTTAPYTVLLLLN
jgi:hypothetical protein